MSPHPVSVFFLFFFNDTATTEIYTLSLHDALPIYDDHSLLWCQRPERVEEYRAQLEDRKSTRLNSSHRNISYAVFCLKKKKKHENNIVMHSKSVIVSLDLTKHTRSTYMSHTHTNATHLFSLYSVLVFFFFF